MITFDPTKCVGCGSCVRVCPMGYLGMEDRIPRPRERALHPVRPLRGHLSQTGGIPGGARDRALLSRAGKRPGGADCAPALGAPLPP